MTGTSLMGHRFTKRDPGKIWENIGSEAKRMRRNPAPAEKKLWESLRNRKVLGVKFRRQHPIEHFIVDFCCPEDRLVVEVDGLIHQYSKEEDAQRQLRLEQLNLTVLRFTNDQVLSDIEFVIKAIEFKIQELKRQNF